MFWAAGFSALPEEKEHAPEQDAWMSMSESLSC